MKPRAKRPVRVRVRGRVRISMRVRGRVEAWFGLGSDFWTAHSKLIGRAGVWVPIDEARSRRLRFCFGSLFSSFMNLGIRVRVRG
jgi:hypothetical protein